MKNSLLYLYCALLLAACEDTKIIRETVNMPLRVNGSIWTWYDTYDNAFHTDADFFVDDFNAIPSVAINGIEADDPFEAGYNHFDFDKPVFPAESLCTVTVQDGERLASSQIRMPGKTNILYPLPGSVMSSRDITAMWTNAKADYYEFYCYYVYEDFQGWYWLNDTLISAHKDTAITLSNFLPDWSLIKRFQYGYLSVLPICGPELMPGIRGNIEDDGVGFIWTYYWQPGVEFSYNQSGTSQIPEWPTGIEVLNSRENVMQSHFQKMFVLQRHDAIDITKLSQ